MYSRATTSAMAERWVLPVGFLVDDILEGSVVSPVPQVCNNFEMANRSCAGRGIDVRAYVLWRRRVSRDVVREDVGVSWMLDTTKKPSTNFALDFRKSAGVCWTPLV